jgi:spermidine synthase
MRQPKYKIILSYFKDLLIESSSSDYNEILDLYLSKGRYQLCTENAIYSYADKYDNFANVFGMIDLSEVKDVLVLGLGLASIPYILEKVHHKSYTYTGVEIDDEVIYLASKYVLDELKSEVQVYNTDAYAYMSQNDSCFELICMDVFVDDKIPDELQELAYLEMLSESLTKNGLLIFNRLANPPHEYEKSKDYFQKVFLKVFPQGRAIETGGNMMLVSK